MCSCSYLDGRVFSALCITPKASSLSAVCKGCLSPGYRHCRASSFAKIRLFDKQINLELEGTLEWAQLGPLHFYAFFF